VNNHGQFGFNAQSFIELDIPLVVRVINRVKPVFTTLFIVFIAKNFKSKMSS